MQDRRLIGLQFETFVKSFLGFGIILTVALFQEDGKYPIWREFVKIEPRISNNYSGTFFSREYIISSSPGAENDFSFF